MPHRFAMNVWICGWHLCLGRMPCFKVGGTSAGSLAPNLRMVLQRMGSWVSDVPTFRMCPHFGHVTVFVCVVCVVKVERVPASFLVVLSCFDVDVNGCRVCVRVYCAGTKVPSGSSNCTRSV